MNKFSLLVLAGLLFGAGSSLAQMAAPLLVPGFTTINPAVIQWGASSRIGAGIVRVDSETVNTGAVTGGSETDGLFAGLRLVGESASFAAETSNLDGSDISGNEVELSSTEVNGAFQLQDAIAIGLSLERTGFEIRVPATGNLLKLESDIVLAGASLKFGDIFFLGGGAGREKVTSTVLVPPLPAITDEVERDLRGFGIGIFDGEGVKWHLEVSVIRAEFARSPALLKADEVDVRNVTVEVNNGGYMFGYYGRKEEKTDKTASPATVAETDSREFAVGWVPDQGLAVVLLLKQSEETGGGDFTEQDTAALLLSYLF